MKLLHDTNGRIVATATDEYIGPDLWVTAPQGFEIGQAPRWRVVGGALVPAVPESVSNAQGSTALIQAGLWTSVLAYVDSIADPTQRALAEVALHKTTEWRRDSPFLAAAAAELGLTPAQLDALFIAAAGVVL